MKRFVTIFLLVCAVALESYAQTVVLKGRVFDEKGEPLIAMTIYQSDDKSVGATTDVDGNYSVTVVPGKTLVFSYLGYEDNVIQVPQGKGTVNLDVVMKSQAEALEAAEVVSVGYGTVAKRDLTGSVTKVEMTDILTSSAVSFDQALEGKVAGVVSTTSDGALGTEANIVIRGNNSLTQSSAPLYVIDGFLSESSMATALNSNDIESIDILKDASATAIYGARGANGVIVITTKQGLEGKPTVTFDAKWTGNMLANKVKLLQGTDFVEYVSDVYEEFGLTNKYLEDGHTIADYANRQSIDWQDQIYRNSLTQQYDISLSGGNKASGTRYRASFSALDQDGIIVKSNFQRYQGKLNLNQKIGKNLEFKLLANYTHTVTNGTTPTSAQAASSATGWLIFNVWGYRPMTPIGSSENLEDDLTDYDAANANDYRFNPAKTVRNEYKKKSVDYLNANAGLTWNITPDLKLQINGGYVLNQTRQEEFYNSQTYTGYVNSPSGKGINGGIYWTRMMSWLNENTLTYTKHLKRVHHINAMAGLTFQGETRDYKGTAATQMTTEALGLNGLHTGNYQTVTPWQYDWRMMSGFARINYNYKYKYYLTASFRADGSSKFPKSNRWGFFPSAGLSYNFNREDALKNSTWLKNGKLRLSWGLTGNNRTTTPYDFYAQITTLPGNQNSYDYVFTGNQIAGYFPNNMQNENLKWETTEQWNVGLDFTFFDKERIKLTVDLYLKNTRDLLLQATIPASSGYTSAMLNIGSMRNKGLEITLQTNNILKRHFSWSTNFNIAFNSNTVTALTNNQLSLFSGVSWEQKFNSQNPYITQVGKPSGMMYGYIYDGTYKYDEFENATSLKDGIPYMGNRDDVRPGDPKYRDINGDGIVNENDRTVIGCGQPIHTGGFGNNFRIYDFDLSIFFSWSYGNDVLNANRLIFENGRYTNTNQFATMKNHFSSANPESDIPRIGANNLFVYSSRVVEDGSFLRLKNVSLGYNFPKKVLRVLHLQTLRLYVSADNLLTFTKYSGPDPEVSTRNSVLTPGFDWSAYPRARCVTGGLSITF